MAKRKTTPVLESAEAEAVKKDYICAECGAIKTTGRSPRGWHVAPGPRTLCGDCWAKAYVSRCISLPVAGPLLSGDNTSRQEQEAAWTLLREAVTGGWTRCMRLANWTITTLLKHEPPPEKDGKLAPLKVYLYGEFNRSHLRDEWAGMTTSANAIIRTVEMSYHKKRGQIQCLGSASAPTFRWPMPLPVPSQNYKLSIQQQHIVVTLNLGGERLDLRIRNDRSSWLQQQRVIDIIEGRALPGELRLVARPVGASDRRNGVSFRKPGGGESKWVRLMIMISANVPITAPRDEEAEGTLFVGTGAESLLYAKCDGDKEPWIINGDQVVRWTREASRRKQRWSDDAKAERRANRQVRQRNVDAYESRARKYRNRMHSRAEEMSAWVINYAKRRRVAELVYDDSIRTLCPQFVFAEFRELLKRKAGEAGLRFVLASAEPPAEPEGLVADE